MTAIPVLGRRVFDRLPARAQDVARDVVARRAGARASDDLLPFLARVDAAIGGFDGKRVVEIGSDHAGVVLRLVADRYSPTELIGLNPAFAARRLPDTIRFERVAAQDSGLPDASVDAVFSSSAFEHIHGVGDVLGEMDRVLVPGGLLYSHFGPIWSTAYGHHLWIEQDGLLAPECGDELAGRMAEFVFASPEQNQLFFDDYERCAAESPFETLLLKGYDAPALADLYPAAQSPALLDRLRERFPDRHGFLYDGITLLLRKS